MKKTSPPDEGLQFQKENVKLKKKVFNLEEDARLRQTDIVGFKKTVKILQQQMEKFAITLGVQNDHAVLLGEIEKLICVEDDNERLKGQLELVRGGDEREVGKAIAIGEKAVQEIKEEKVDLSDEVKQLKSRRNLDKYKTLELAKETVKKFFQNILEGIKRFPKKVISKIKGVITSWK